MINFWYQLRVPSQLGTTYEFRVSSQGYYGVTHFNNRWEPKYFAILKYEE